MKKEKKNLLSQIITEYKQVQWPTTPEVIQVTIVVLLITLFISLMILIKLILSKKNSHKIKWQARQESNPQLSVLETDALPLNYWPI